MNNKTQLTDKTQPPHNHELQAVDKAPGEEQDKGELVTNKELKGKKVDADPSKQEDQPLSE